MIYTINSFLITSMLFVLGESGLSQQRVVISTDFPPLDVLTAKGVHTKKLNHSRSIEENRDY